MVAHPQEWRLFCQSVIGYTIPRVSLISLECEWHKTLSGIVQSYSNNFKCYSWRGWHCKCYRGPRLKKWGVGLGFLGEHGAESIHARFNTLRRTFAKIPDPTKRLHAILKEHLLQVCPDNLDKMPEVQKRVFKKPRNTSCCSYLLILCTHFLSP